MTRRTAATGFAALAALATVCACTGTEPTNSNADDTTATQPPATATLPTPDEPQDITRIPENTLLEPGTYSVPLLAEKGSTRAIVDIPDGYTPTVGGMVIGSDTGDVAFWGKVTKVDTDPCLGGKHIEAGTSVRDLVSLLAAQRHMRTSHPKPVTIGGYHGVYLKLIAPEDIQRCRDGSVTIYTAGDDWLQWDVPNAIFYQWILNVRGQRVVGGARIIPDAANRAELIGMVESAEFNVAD
jgi:hypothetical protein